MADLTQHAWTVQSKNDSNAVLLDVRTDEEVEEGKIPTALHIDIYKGQGFIDEINQLDKSKTYYVYCRSGKRSAQACEIMRQSGFENTHNLLGGILEWTGDVE